MVMEIAGELRGNHTIHYSGMLPIAINGSWNAPITSVHSYWSGEIWGLDSSGMRCAATSHKNTDPNCTIVQA